MKNSVINTEKVSVVMPVYKVEQYVRKSLESIVKQSYKNLELIIVNDGSPDNSIDIAREYLATTNIEWKIVNQDNQGVSAARNNGISVASGEWIICPDSDDYLLPEAIEKMLFVAKKYDVEFVFTNFKRVSENNISERCRSDNGVAIYTSDKIKRKFFNHSLIVLVTSMLIKRSVFEKIKYEVGCSNGEDVHFLWRLFYSFDGFAFINADLYNYLTRTTSAVFTLRPQAYLSTSSLNKSMVSDFSIQFPKDPIVPLIYPRFRLGGLHVLARSTSYSSFKNTVNEDGPCNMKNIIVHGGLILSSMAIVYSLSLRLFYLICRRF